MQWRHRRGSLSLDDAPGGARVMGIVNLTPDSFSDGGRWAIDHALLDVVGGWVAAGLEIVDLGGESTRPGSAPVHPDDEQARILPAIAALRADPRTCGVVVSVDTRHAATAAATLQAGADLVNDVSGLADPEMAAVVARHGAGLVIGHMRGTPATMMRDTHFDAPFEEVAASLGQAASRAMAAGVPGEAIVVDPCLGFGKGAAHSAAWIWWPGRLQATVGHPVLIGASRKRFIGGAIEAALHGPAPAPSERLAGSLAAAVLSVQRGARVVRVHDVRETLEARAVAAAVVQAAGHGGHEAASPPAASRGSTQGLGAALGVDDSLELVDAVVAWARGRAGRGQGALLVFEGRDEAGAAALRSGRAVRDPSPARLDEDGALVIAGALHRRPRLVRTGEVLPLAAGPLAPPLGLRHRAAVGLTGRCDALVVVVSESRGTVRLAHAGRIGAPLGERELGAALHRWLDGEGPIAGETR